jgi:heterodisulfide reductase subunit A
MSVAGRAGAFEVALKQHPRYVDMTKCIACGLCMEKCPRKVDDEFNMAISKRKAAYIKYGQTVPLKYAIDGENCLYVTKGKCRACEKFCPTGAINFQDQEKVISVNVGAVILAPGFTHFDPGANDFYGYGRIPDLVTSSEYERLLSASGPNMGHLIRPSDGREPKKIAWIQCVGSRHTNRYNHGYCSSVCCMYAIKQAVVTAEHLPGEHLEQKIFYINIRSHGKEFERYYEAAKAKGVRFIKARPRIMPGRNNIGVTLMYFTEEGRRVIEDVDLTVLSVGLEAPRDGPVLASRIGFELNHYGFARTGAFAPVSSSREGIYVVGAFQSPKDIPQSVTEASCAASEAARLLAAAKGTLTREKTYPPERDLTGEAPKVGVFVCSCGINIAGVIDVQEVVQFARSLPHVALVEINLFTCSTDTQSLIAGRIKEHHLNRIVVAACTPRTHEPMFQDTLREAGLNPYLLEMANIRNQNAWVHQNDPRQATRKAKDQVRMAVAKAVLNRPLERLSVPVTQRVLVLGGGMSGMSAALDFATQGIETLLVEAQDKLGGHAWSLNTTWQGEPVRPRLEAMVSKTENHPHIEVLKKTRIKTCSGSVGNFSSDIETPEGTRTIQYGAVVIATGANEYQPHEYLFGQDERVMTHLQFDRRLREEHDRLREARCVVFIQCVGSREPERPYCSRVCCTHSVQSAIALKQLQPGVDVFILNRDIRTYGQWEDLYRQARDMGVVFVRYTWENKPVVQKDGPRLRVQVTDAAIRRDLVLQPDLVVLAAAVVPHDNRALVELFKCSVNADGFINEAHPKLRPVDMSVDGLFVAGLCHYPKPLDEAITQAKAAVSRAGVILSREQMQLDAVKSSVTERCDGCALCIDVCPYRALTLESYASKGRQAQRIKVDAALCKGCGLCQATCPKGGVQVHGFTLEQLKAQTDAVLLSGHGMRNSDLSGEQPKTPVDAVLSTATFATIG